MITYSNYIQVDSFICNLMTFFLLLEKSIFETGLGKLHTIPCFQRQVLCNRNYPLEAKNNSNTESIGNSFVNIVNFLIK